MSVVNWRIFCATESKYVETFIKQGEPIPIRCPNNTDHSVSGAAELMGVTKNEEIIIKEEVVASQGYFRVEGKKMTCPANSVTEQTIDHAYPISLFAFFLCPDTSNINDIVNVYVNIGTIDTVATQIEIGTTIVPIVSIPVSNIPIGFEILIDNVSIGEVIDKDIAANTITFGTGTAQVFTVGNLIKLRNRITKNFTIGDFGNIPFGLSKIGASHIPKEYFTTIEYTNLSPTENKQFIYYAEYCY